MMFLESWTSSSCSAFSSATCAISTAPWWWGIIASINRSSEYRPFSIRIPEVPFSEPWCAWSLLWWAIPPVAFCCSLAVPCDPPPEPAQEASARAVASASKTVRIRLWIR
jgi:hypothetical protein